MRIQKSWEAVRKLQIHLVCATKSSLQQTGVYTDTPAVHRVEQAVIHPHLDGT